jgi:hypothetical protein
MATNFPLHWLCKERREPKNRATHNTAPNYCDAGCECKLKQLISELVTLEKSSRCGKAEKSSISAQPDASLRFMLVRGEWKRKKGKKRKKRSDVSLANVTNNYSETGVGGGGNSLLMLADDVKNYIFAVDCQFVNEAKPIPPDSLLEDFFLIKKLPPRWYAQECRFGVLSWAFGARKLFISSSRREKKNVSIAIA